VVLHYLKKNSYFTNFRIKKIKYFTLPVVDFEGVILCIVTFRIQRNSTQSTQKSCFSLDVVCETHSAISCHIFITFGAENVSSHIPDLSQFLRFYQLLVLIIFLLPWFVLCWNSESSIREVWMPDISFDLIERQNKTAVIL
jgi:hypothetical protein